MNNRISQIKNTEEMKRVGSYQGRSFTNQELKEALIDTQDVMMGATFEKNHAENIGRHDFYKYYFNAGSEYDLSEDATYRRFINELKITKNTIGSLIAGEIGEKRVINALRLLEMDGSRILSNIELRTEDGECAEIDSIVINESGIHVLEVKNYKQNVEVTGSGELTADHNNHVYHLAAKLAEKEYCLKKALEAAGIDVNVPYESILVIADDNTMFTDNYGYVPVCYVSGIIPHIRNKKGEKIDVNEVNKIANAIIAQHQGTRYEWNMLNFEEFINDFAYVMSAIEEKSRVLSQDEVKNDEKAPHKEEGRIKDNTVVKCILSGLAGAVITAIGFSIFK